MLHGKVLRSPLAHARIVSIDTATAEAIAGVVAVLIGSDLLDIDPYLSHAIRDHPIVTAPSTGSALSGSRSQASRRRTRRSPRPRSGRSPPAYSTIFVTMTNFDNATPLAKETESYAKVSGTLDNAAFVTPLKVTNPNGAGGATTSIGSLSPAAVSLTFTIAALGINVPIAAHARTKFTIDTGAPGTSSWRCFDPCGAGAAGWGAATAVMRGYMEGTLTVA